MKFSEQTSRILDRIQRHIPLVPEPFAALARELTIDEDIILGKIAQLKDNGLIRNISGIFNAEGIGYQTNLISFEVAAENIEQAARLISSHPGVSHNYLRSHQYNIWFTLSLEEETPYEETVAYLAEKAGARSYLILKNEKLLKIGLMLKFGEKQDNAAREAAREAKKGINKRKITPEVREAIILLQHDLPIVTRPFQALIASSGSSLDEEKLLSQAVSFKEDRLMRRYTAVVRHRIAGFLSNAMTVWKPGDTPEDTVEKVFVREQAISHLYLRTIHPGKWEYPLFAMIHAHSDEELSGIVDRLSADSGITDYQILHSIQEFKKQRVQYFSSEFENWRNNHHD